MVIIQENKNRLSDRSKKAYVPVVQLASLEQFGHYLALDLLSWIQQNPEGVISLPTGRTPESLIRALRWYRVYWDSSEAQAKLRERGLDTGQFPDTSGIKFVQMDEFLWMRPQDSRSFSSYLLDNYIEVLGIQSANCLFMDFSNMGFDLGRIRRIVDQQGGCSLDYDQVDFQSALRDVDQFCEDYEKRIQSWGGIGYFLGGIGLDGHIAYNVAESSIDSKTRVVQLNQASKIGFIKKDYYLDYALTIGLDTIFQRDDVQVVLGAVGEEKAEVVQKIIQGPVVDAVPASHVQHCANGKIVINRSAGRLIAPEKDNRSQKGVAVSVLDRVIIERALELKKQLIELSVEDFVEHDLYDLLHEDFQVYVSSVRDRLIQKIERGLAGWSASRILHTAPHHDDIMLGYLPLILREPELQHQMMYLVSGSNGVSDQYVQDCFKGEFQGKSLQEVKMEIREQEAESLWNSYDQKWGVSHMRSPFYNASFFKSEPIYDKDIAPCVDILSKFSPELILVLNDSELHGPSTHHVAFKVVMQAIAAYRRPIQVLGYRNVWDRYRIDEAAVIVPVSQEEYDHQHKQFITCFGSQEKALYPSKHGEEPFTVYAQKTQREQYQEVVTLLGEKYFKKHADPKMRSAQGLVILEEISF